MATSGLRLHFVFLFITLLWIHLRELFLTCPPTLPVGAIVALPLFPIYPIIRSSISQRDYPNRRNLLPHSSSGICFTPFFDAISPLPPGDFDWRF
ncbi:hypothetical protein K1719_001060 [Acacia pycnantha]|nr:hypothetical protein K1719_001060 [Acacia pycnantha]